MRRIFAILSASADPSGVCVRLFCSACVRLLLCASKHRKTAHIVSKIAQADLVAPDADDTYISVSVLPVSMAITPKTCSTRLRIFALLRLSCCSLAVSFLWQ